MKLTKIKKTPLHQLVYDDLKNAILTGELAPGSPLNQTTIAEDMEVSRMPVRDALRMLEMDKLITYNKDFGYTVSDFSDEYKQDIIIARSVIEPSFLLLSKGKFDEKDIKKMRDWIKEANAAIERLDMREVDRINRAFHFFIYGKSGAKTLYDMVDKLWDTYPKDVMSNTRARVVSWQEHERVCDAIEQGDYDKAAEILKEHIVSITCRGDSVNYF